MPFVPSTTLFGYFASAIVLCTYTLYILSLFSAPSVLHYFSMILYATTTVSCELVYGGGGMMIDRIAMSWTTIFGTLGSCATHGEVITIYDSVSGYFVSKS